MNLPTSSAFLRVCFDCYAETVIKKESYDRRFRFGVRMIRVWRSISNVNRIVQ